jgi:hypothetical protein
MGDCGVADAPSLSITRPAESLRVVRWRTMPHEWAFGAMLLVMAARLLWQPGVAQVCSLLFGLYFLAGFALIWWCTSRPTPWRWRVRLMWYHVSMGLVFYTLPTAVRQLGVASADSLLQAADHLYLARPAADYFAVIQSVPATEIFLAAYLFFFWYLLAGPLYYCWNDVRRLRFCILGMYVIYAVGLLSYSLFPAGGPHLALHFSQALPAGPLGRLMLPVIDRSSNGVDVFPSIHVAISAYLLAFDWRNHRRRALLLLFPCVLLWVSTIYLRYHYLVDVFAGFALATAGLAASRWYERSEQEREIEQEAQRAAA